MVILWGVRVFWKLTHGPKREDNRSYMRIKPLINLRVAPALTCTVSVASYMMINEIMKPTLTRI